MNKLLPLSLLVMATLSACGPQLPAPSMLSANLRSQTAAPAAGARALNLNKAASQSQKAGSRELAISQSKGLPKPAAPFEVKLEAQRRDLSTNEVMSIARIGLDSMERSSTYESGYTIGRSTLETLARHNAYIARLAVAATNPEMKYETAYKAVAKALSFIANNREITVASACDLVREMMNHAKTWEDGTRIGYATMAFIRTTASASVRAVIDSSVRSAEQARYWEDAYHILNNAYGQIRYMN